MNVRRKVKKAKEGDKEALLQLILDEKDAYYRLARMYMGNSHDAMDAMQDMIVTVYEKIEQLKKENAFYSWSKTILVNECKTMLRKRNKVTPLDWRDSVEESFERATERSAQPQLQAEQQLEIEALLRHVNEHQKEAIQLRYFHDLDYETIAEMMDVSLGTVKSRIHQGLKKLRDRFGRDGDA
ncbi:RNA polymerase subunit sigma-24 [Ammoniphilus oxalaticus]|uniref:RNA polymerase subunit sigma-24 n=1 Tax=Ammoniphilus oxalaticus TaxID=66863 RepID=A0A419SR88_9BACL|nr:sigma-70 family RNA polymerase sigma factor [Ammoniphilus oxalaticus]RKD27032.1 RNA polymerase subunit sigma-24 [Ammoniphilus oxalaticus]